MSDPYSLTEFYFDRSDPKLEGLFQGTQGCQTLFGWLLLEKGKLHVENKLNKNRRLRQLKRGLKTHVMHMPFGVCKYCSGCSKRIAPESS